MNDYLPKSELEPKDPKKPSQARLALWIIVGGIGVYLVVTGVWGIITGGN